MHQTTAFYLFERAFDSHCKMNKVFWPRALIIVFLAFNVIHDRPAEEVLKKSVDLWVFRCLLNSIAKHRIKFLLIKPQNLFFKKKDSTWTSCCWKAFPVSQLKLRVSPLVLVWLDNWSCNFEKSFCNWNGMQYSGFPCSFSSYLELS